MRKKIPVAEPALCGNEKQYVLDCLDTTWISSAGKYLSRFEEEFASFCNAKHAMSCCNGTVAVHLALLALGVGPGDEVIVPTLTFVATANAVTYCGARPIFIDSEPETWNMDVNQVEALITPRTKGVIAVHLYGHPVDMDPLLATARKHGLFVVEDAAEAHGGLYKNRRVGSLADIAVFSFYGNKIVTCGEGGMVVTDDPELARKVRLFKGQGMDPARRYWFPTIGYNYRMTNIEAAIGLAQLEKVDWLLARKREIAEQYAQCLRDVSGVSLQPEKEWARNVYWMNSALLDPSVRSSRDEVMRRLDEAGIETRPFFYPMHTLPMYRESVAGRVLPVAGDVAMRGMNLPSSVLLTAGDVEYVCDNLARAMRADDDRP
jgi:perosamine synthetase